MPSRCATAGCSNTTKDGVSLHRFPSDPKYRRIRTTKVNPIPERSGRDRRNTHSYVTHTSSRHAGVSSLDGFEKSRGTPYAFKILIILPRWIQSKAFLKSMKVSTTDRLFFLTSSMILRRARICANVDLFSLKPFWLNLSLGSMAVLIRLSMMSSSSQFLNTSDGEMPIWTRTLPLTFLSSSILNGPLSISISMRTVCMSSSSSATVGGHPAGS